MKHYKFICHVSKEEYTSSNIFMEIYAEGETYREATSNASNNLKEQYGFTLDKFDNINISFQWED